MKQLLLPFLFIFCLSAAKAQPDTTKGSIKAAPSPCYDIHITLGGEKKSIFTYHQARGHSGFVAQVHGCMKNSTLKILSYNIAINDGKPVTRKGPNFDFSNLDAYQAQRLTITDCLVECAVEGEPVKLITIPKTEFTVIGEP